MKDKANRRFRRTRGLIALALVYAAAAYFVIPAIWKLFEHVDASQQEMVTRTTADIPGDPINVGLAGDREEIFRSFAAAGWDTADPITLKTSVEIGLAVLFDHPFPDAPVSTLLFFLRPQDLAFEKPIGDSPDRRHHIRLWQSTKLVDGKPLWFGSASLDIGSGLSHDTGQITHHIGPDVDAERDLVIHDFTVSNWVGRVSEMPGRGATQDGRNGGGDRYFTDGKVKVGVLQTPTNSAAGPRRITPQEAIEFCQLPTLEAAIAAGDKLGWRRLSDKELAEWQSSAANFHGASPNAAVWWRTSDPQPDGLAWWSVAGMQAHRACSYTTTDKTGLREALDAFYGTPQLNESPDIGYWDLGKNQIAYSSVGSLGYVTFGFYENDPTP